MGHHPFAQSASSRRSTPNQRRSTRVEFTIPVILSGRDAAAQLFRDETQTVTVNLHGARILTRHNLLVGMHVTVECPRTGKVEDAICVRTDELLPEEDKRHVSIQLIRPGNIWGIENPPADWTIIENSALQAQPALPPRAVMEQPEIVIDAHPPHETELKDQATQIVDAAAQRLRTLVEEMLRTAFEDFQQRLDAALSAAEARLAVHTDESNAQVESTLKKFREELDLQTERTVASTEQVLRAQIPSIVASIFKPGAQLPSTLNVDLKNKQ